MASLGRMLRLHSRCGTVPAATITSSCMSTAAAAPATSMKNPTIKPPSPPTPPSRPIKRSGSGRLPKRHSRHAFPPACSDRAELEQLTQQVLEVPPGRLFTYAAIEEGKHWAVCDLTVQKVEYLMRGYALRVDGTIARRQFLHPDGAGSAKAGSTTVEVEDPVQLIPPMRQLVDRMIQEGDMYMELRQRMRSQLAVEQNREGSATSSPAPSSSPKEEGNAASVNPDTTPAANDPSNMSSATSTPDQPQEKQQQEFASPGLTISMIDTLMDTMVFAAEADPLPTAEAELAMLELALARFEQDGGHKSNSNPVTIPTAVTWNAPLRAASRMDPSSSERVRDIMLRDVIGLYDEMTHFPFQRNAATYTYLFRTLSKVLPTCSDKGYISLGFWQQACDVGVISESVLDAMRDMHTPSNGPEFQAVLEKDGVFPPGAKLRGKTWYWSVKKFRYDPTNDDY